MDKVKQQAARIITHSVKLGFPPNVLPDVQYLEKIVRTRNCPLFENFLQRTEVRQTIDCIRKNILINAAKQETTSQSLPLQLQRFLTYMKLKAKVQDAQKRNNQMKEREKAHLNKGIALNIRKMKLVDSRKAKEMKVNILRAKTINLNETIAKEQSFEKKIRSVSPPKYSAEMNVEDMKERIKQCLSLLKHYYSNNQNAEQLWIKIRNILDTVPNVFTFQMILKQLDINSNVIEQLSSSLPIENSSIYSLQLLAKLSQQQIIAGIEFRSQKSKSANVKTKCTEVILNVTSELEDNLNISSEYSFEFSDEDVVGDYVSAMLKHLVLQGKHQHAINVVNKLKAQSEEMNKASKEYILTMQDTQKRYDLVEEKVGEVQQNIAQLFKISQKLNFVKISMTHLVQDVKNSCKQHDMSRMFMLTKSENMIPDHLSEIRTFLDTPVIKFEKIPNIVSSELNNNFLIADSVTILTDRKHLVISSFNQLLNDMKNAFTLHRELQQIASKVEPKIKCPPETSIDELTKKLKVNRESICELMDEITKTNVKTKSLLRQNHVLYQYCLKNPLKNFIPSSKKFDGKSFKAYENEFNLYYGMLKD